MARVALRGLSRRYAGAQAAALESLSLDVAEGELLVLVGPSGCGKSTALRLIAGLDAPDAGAILIGDRDVSRVPPQDRDVAMVFQGYALYPHLTVRENLAFPLRMRNVPAADRAGLIADAAAMLGIARLLDRRPAELSGGERQRVAMGRAIVRKPKVFLFDEPLSNLDAALRAELRVEIASLVRRLGVTSLYVTHDQVEAMTMGSRIAVLRGGSLQQVGAPREIYEDPVNDFVAGFLGSPPMNWIDMIPEGDQLRGAGALFPFPEGIALPEQIKAGVRPERIHLHKDRAAEGAIEVAAVVTATEPLGAETHLILEAASAKIRAKTAGFDAPSIGDRVSFHIDPRTILWFDGRTGARLVPRG